jgi:hypothetical protein
MFERRKIRKLIEALEVNPNLDTELDHYTSDDSGMHWTISARECTPLTCERLVSLVWDLIESSKSVRQYRQIVWAIGGHRGLTFAEERRIGPFGFWFGGPGERKGLFSVSARLHYESGPLGGVEVNVIRVSPQEFRASISHYARLKDLNDRPWTESSYW